MSILGSVRYPILSFFLSAVGYTHMCVRQRAIRCQLYLLLPKGILHQFPAQRLWKPGKKVKSGSIVRKKAARDVSTLPADLRRSLGARQQQSDGRGGID